jgi:cytochrome c oxidase subunit 6b
MGVAHSQEERRGDEAAGAALDAVPHAPGALADDEALTPQEAAALRAQAAVHEAEAAGEAALKSEANAAAPEEAEEAGKAEGEADPAGEVAGADDGGGRAVVLQTAPLDRRFPNPNQSRRCFTNVEEAFRCRAERGEDAPECAAFTRAYRSVCPQEWLERWQELRDEGRWFGKY